MNDLIYGGTVYRDELEKLFPGCKITDASDEIHEDRISLEIEMDRMEYMRIICLNGFFDASFAFCVWCRAPGNKIEFHNKLAEWKRDYPQYFKE